MKANTKKLNIVSGQLRAISRMIEEGSDCEKVIIQFKATKGALEKIYLGYLEESLKNCIKPNDSKKMIKILDDVLKN